MTGRTAVAATLVLPTLFLGFLTECLGQQPAPTADIEDRGLAFEFTQVASGVYVAIGTGLIPTVCNAAIIINESDVVIVDTHVTPAAATALSEELKEITSKPVRYVINTHFHLDHSFGNQVYSPEVEIIGHEFTREVILAGGSVSGRGFNILMARRPDYLASLREQFDTTSDAGARAELQQRIAYEESFLSGVASVVPTPPNRTFSERMTLYRGDREIRILFLGRGHTGGDLVVHLPQERVLISGDLFFSDGPAYMGDGYFTDWVETLEKLKALDFQWVISSHEEPFQNRNAINNFQSYIEDFWAQAQALYQAGVSAEEAASRIDMRSHSVHYPGIRRIGVRLDAAERAYELLANGAGG